MTCIENAPLSGEQVRRYLDRIGLSDVPASAQPSVELLDRLVCAHQLSVPFSTADIALRPVTPSLELDVLYKKLVEDEQRGNVYTDWLTATTENASYETVASGMRFVTK